MWGQYYPLAGCRSDAGLAPPCLCPPNPRQSSGPLQPRQSWAGSWAANTPGSAGPHLAQPQPPTQPSYPPILRHISRAVATPTTHITRHVAKDKHSETMKWDRESHDNFLLEENKFYLIEMLSTISIVLSDNSRWHFWEPGDVSSIFIENHLSFRNTQNHFRKLSWKETDNLIHKKTPTQTPV